MEQDELLRFAVEALNNLGLRDITGILRVSGEQVDRTYIADWAERLDLNEIWSALARRVPP
ncbi:MAG TPA: hypothetical protein VHB47_26595 [Thermoanaerobaculia bacterium]|jgi:hypothetical protein|nr:hypothetical protein [Thermoanaerobaculia bacterium]